DKSCPADPVTKAAPLLIRESPEPLFRFGFLGRLEGIEEILAAGDSLEGPDYVRAGESGANQLAIGGGELSRVFQRFGQWRLGVDFAANETVDELQLVDFTVNPADSLLSEGGADGALAEVAENARFTEALILQP